ncbi:BRO-N domain-containing protein [Micromonospora echinospora]
MSEIVPFDFGSQRVRVVMIDGDPWWVVNDVCAVLGIADPRTAAQRIDRDDVGLTHVIDGMGRAQQTNVVNEPGLYELVFRSDKPAAKDFRRWVVADVLPQIRKTGAYAVEQLTPAEMLLRQAQQLVDQERRIRAVSSGLADVTARVDAIEGRTGWWIALAFAKRQGLPTDHSYLLRLGKRAAAIARAAGVEPVKTDSVVYGTVNSLPEWAWEQAAGEIA